MTMTIGENELRAGIYVASKVAHAELWRDLRNFEREPIISTWIDEAGIGESASLEDLWRRCVHEASNAGALIVYRRPDEVLKGAWVELGAALANGVPVFAVGIEEFTVANHAGITHCADLIEARRLARGALDRRSAGLGTVSVKPFVYGIRDVRDGVPHFDEMCVSVDRNDLDEHIDGDEGLEVVALYLAPAPEETREAIRLAALEEAAVVADTTARALLSIYEGDGAAGSRDAAKAIRDHAIRSSETRVKSCLTSIGVEAGK